MDANRSFPKESKLIFHFIISKRDILKEFTKREKSTSICCFPTLVAIEALYKHTPKSEMRNPNHSLPTC